MDIVDVSKKTLDIAWTAADFLLFFKSIPIRIKNRRDLERNRKLVGSHVGERCFVMGGGPSLRDVDFSSLAGEQVIGVNFLFRLEDYVTLEPVYHCAIDPGMYKGEAGDSFLKFAQENPNTKFFITSKADERFRSLDNVIVASLGYLPTSFFHPFDLSKPSAAFLNVPCAAIELALYLGFSEIVLLGCDFSQFASRVDTHAYEEEPKLRITSLFSDLLGHAITIMQHEYLLAEAQRRGVKIVNATEGSFLETYPRVALSGVLG